MQLDETKNGSNKLAIINPSRVVSRPFLTHTPILASLFRQHAASVRAQGPPTAYPLGLQPIASDDFSGRQGRRISRTDLDFEQALRAEGTVVLREGVDVNSLGVDASPANSKGWTSPAKSTPVARTISRVALQPSTPIVVPPTPSPAPSTSTRLMTTNASSSAVGSLLQSSSPKAHDDDLEDSERQTNRRSLYRSPGTSSSPDLATLLRKAKERGRPAVSATGHHKRHESPPPPLPDAATQQPSSSNSYLSSTSPLSKSRSGAENHSTERVISSARQPKENGTLKVNRFHIYVNWGWCLIVYLATQAIGESKD
jgi:PH and SEC7 domain-containing protein